MSIKVLVAHALGGGVGHTGPVGEAYSGSNDQLLGLITVTHPHHQLTSSIENKLKKKSTLHTYHILFIFVLLL